MVARGDMGVEIPPESVPMVQKDLIRQCNKLGKPVITATQMLDSMQRNPRATRAEASDVANAIYDGTDAVMLSGETAAGLYPEEAVKTMRNIAISAEAAQDYKRLLSDRTKLVQTSLVNAIGVSVAHTALNLNVKAIVAATESGSTARTISKYRPKSDIIAVTPHAETARQCALVWGIHPVVKEGRKTTDAMLNTAVATAVETEKVQNGDLIIITAGVPTGEKGTTNMMKLHLVGDELAKGQGIGRNSVVGNTLVVNDASELEGKDLSETVIVTTSVDETLVPYIEQASGLIAEESGITSPSAIIGLEKGIPTIVGVENATKEIQNDILITVDANQGKVFEGYANVL